MGNIILKKLFRIPLLSLECQKEEYGHLKKGTRIQHQRRSNAFKDLRIGARTC